MTRRQLDKAHAELNQQYEHLRRILVAVVRERGMLRVTKDDYDAADRAWVIAVEPVERGVAVEVTAANTKPRIIMSPPGLVIQ